ncbi:MAG TPA: S9 family peptidase, partial [Novosphingobium sp.]|nr:S9 family peptidase [Novosphingobium sp.]
MSKRRNVFAAQPLLRLSAACFALATVSAAPAARSQTAPQAAAQTHAMTAQDLVTLTRIAAPVASPDGRLVVWQQTSTDPATYQRKTTLWQAPAAGGAPVAVPGLPETGASAPAFSPDGRRLYFLAADGAQKGGSDQLWLIDLAHPGTPARQVSHFKADVAGFAIAPNGRRVLVWGAVARDCATLGCGPADAADTSLTGPGSGRLHRDGVGFVRHWDAWATPGVYNRGFAFTLDDTGAVAGEGVALDGAAGASGAITADMPTKPFGDGGDPVWAADSASVFFSARLSNRDEPTSTNLDIWQSRLDGQGPENLTAGNRGMDALPAVSRDGRWLAWAAMARAGYEADRQVVYLRDLRTGQTRALTQGWDRSAASLAWAPDSRSLIATADDVLDHPAFRIDVASGKVTRLSLAPAGQKEGHIGA